MPEHEVQNRDHLNNSTESRSKIRRGKDTHATSGGRLAVEIRKSYFPKTDFKYLLIKCRMWSGRIRKHCQWAWHSG
jgi:hypothetical protein